MSSKIANASSAATELPSNPAAGASDTLHEVDKTCVVCFKIVDIFSIGECDHPVCYECSTSNAIYLQISPSRRSENNHFPLSFLFCLIAIGMRVLCKQNECPICRRINQKVIFTSDILPYRALDQKNRSGLYDKAFRISFSGQRTQNAFQRLLQHRCNK